MPNIPWNNRKTAKWILEHTKVQDTVHAMRKLTRKWADYQSKTTEGQSKLQKETPLENNRNKGKQKTCWPDEINNFVSIPKGTSEWYQLIQNQMAWRNTEKAYAQQWTQ